jgi:uncharacterized protein (TIGR02145 family)
MSENGAGTGDWVETSVAKNYVTIEKTPSDPTANVNNAEDGGRGICLAGYHVPTDQDWANLLDNVESNGSYTAQVGPGWFGADAGKILKSASTYVGADPADGSWALTTSQGTDAFGFGMLPPGSRDSDGSSFVDQGNKALFWSSSATTASSAWFRQFASYYANSYRNTNRRSLGLSVRCVKN